MYYYRTLIALVLILGLSKTAVAGSCSQPVTYVLVNTPAPCTGYLFSPDKEAELRLEHEKYTLDLQIISLKDQELGLYKQQVTDLQEAVKLEQQKAELWRKNAEESMLKLNTVIERQGWRDYLFLGLGIGLTALAGWAVGQAHK